MKAKNPKGPSTQYRRTLVLKIIPSVVLGPRVLRCCVLGPSGEDILEGVMTSASTNEVAAVQQLVAYRT